MAYTPNVWKNGEVGNTPVNAARLNRLEAGVVDAAAGADAIAASIADLAHQVALLTYLVTGSTGPLVDPPTFGRGAFGRGRFGH